MPLCVVNRVVIDSARCAESLASVCATNEHYITASVKADGLNAREHVNIVVRSCAGTICRQKNLTDQSVRINRLAENDVAAKVHCSALVESWDYGAVLCVC